MLRKKWYVCLYFLREIHLSYTAKGPLGADFCVTCGVVLLHICNVHMNMYSAQNGTYKMSSVCADMSGHVC